MFERILSSAANTLVAADDTGDSAATAPLAVGQRRRIWQLDVGMHCSVLGTCLSMNDLWTIARRARYALDASASPYTVHSWFVDFMATPNVLSKLVDKELEKRHRIAIHRIRRARTVDELETGWKEVIARGDIAGAYWAAMSHPLASNGHQWRFFGEIHMLSHLVGASRRADLAQLHELEVTCGELDGKLAQLKHDHRAGLHDRKKLEEELVSQRRACERSERRLANAQERIAVLEAPTCAKHLEARIAELAHQLSDALAVASGMESSLSEFRVLLEEARRDEALADEQIRELAAENHALEIELESSMVCPLAERSRLDDSGDVAGLCGKRILCVGGRINLVQHYRALVERRGGEFLHHDGGLEDSLEAVTRAMSTVDAVVCPIDCVSHAASLKVKRACKHLAKRFIPLRSSGLSSFARGLQTIAEPTSSHESLAPATS